jgi:hypothetical protein
MVGIQNNMPPDPQQAEAEKDAAVKKSLGTDTKSALWTSICTARMSRACLA